MRNPPLLNIVGCGRLGSTLGKLLHDHQLVTLQVICNQTLISAQAASDFIGAGRAVASIQDLPQADITLLAVPDKLISSVCESWIKSPAAQSGSILFHASGALSSEALDTARNKDVHVASVHPLKSFASPEQAYQTFAGTFCAIEGDEAALSVLCPLFEALGADLGRIGVESKTLYHAACVMACGGLTALYASSEKLLVDAGLPQETVRKILGPYMKMTLDNNTALGSTAALTGPVARGDQVTLDAHTTALEHESKLIQDLYQVLTELQQDVIARRYSDEAIHPKNTGLLPSGQTRDRNDGFI